MKNITIQNIKGIVLGLILVLGVAYVSAYSDWVPAPVEGPPNKNVDAPINVGTSAQYKTGTLGLVELFTSYLNVKTPGVTIVPGQVLVAENSDGKVKWGSVSAARWINIDSGVGEVDGSCGYNSTNLYGNCIAYPNSSTDRSPTSMCVRAGYTAATGACKYTDTDGDSYESTYIFSKEGGQTQNFTCNFGPTGYSVFAKKAITMSILCI